MEEVNVLLTETEQIHYIKPSNGGVISFSWYTAVATVVGSRRPSMTIILLDPLVFKYLWAPRLLYEQISAAAEHHLMYGELLEQTWAFYGSSRPR